ncbi:MAG: toxin secretion, membrane fusion protein [Anaerolineaceae bacterium]
MNHHIALVVKKVKLQQQGNDFAYWQSQPYEARLAALEEIRREYHDWINSTSKETADVQPGFQRVCRIIKRS